MGTIDSDQETFFKSKIKFEKKIKMGTIESDQETFSNQK